MTTGIRTSQGGAWEREPEARALGRATKGEGAAWLVQGRRGEQSLWKIHTPSTAWAPRQHMGKGK